MDNIISFPQPLIGARELARLLGVSYPTIKLWGAKGRLDGLRIKVGARYRYDFAQVEGRLKTGEFASVAR